MGSLILCYKKKAKQPYEVTRIHRKIYTIEELCYYLCNNLYLIDYTIMNEQLCEWLEEELEMSELAKDLRELLQHHGSMERFVMIILSASSIYTKTELCRTQNILDRLKNQKGTQRKKYKADNLLESGAVKPAILIYQSILHEEHDESLDGKFYGKVYACLGSAYGRLFLYEEAAKMYEAAYQICEEESMLKAYIYACYNYMDDDEYQEMIKKSPLYMDVAVEVQKERKEIQECTRPVFDERTFLDWKEEYRRIATGES